MPILKIDLTQPQTLPIPADLGLGTCTSPSGATLTADGVRLYRDGKPWIPVMGEFHYSRVPAAEWKAELLKMKGGGIDIVSSYVFWIHHEEIRGEFVWTGDRDLSKFLSVCAEVGLLAVVRLGPWCHGEVRNGGFPDWIQSAGYWDEPGPFKNRSEIPEFMADVSRLYGEIAKQTLPHLWKHGGPVIAIQVDNECWNLPYLHALKRLAVSHGFDVPFTTMTGWNNVPLPESELIPLFGGYADGFWVEDKPSMRKTFLFTPTRDDGDMGAVDGKIVNLRPDRDEIASRFPYLCCEIGGGMPSAYHNRLHLTPEDTAALALIKLGSGNNLPGYYMYHGGTNPEGRLATLHETRASGYPNDLPVKNYDFEAPIGDAGQMRGQWFLLRQQHQFLRRFGAELSALSAVFPQEMPSSFSDTETVRWTVRGNNSGGFLFLCNHQRYQQLPSRESIQFGIATTAGKILVPEDPIDVPGGTLAILPVSVNFSGVHVRYATVQPLGRLQAQDETWEFMAAIQGVRAEICFEGERPAAVEPGYSVALRRQSADGGWVNFIVLPADDGARFSILDGVHATISSSAVWQSGPREWTAQSESSEEARLLIFPKPSGLASSSLNQMGVFTEYTLTPAPPAVSVNATQSRLSVHTGLPGTDERAWEAAEEWALEVPSDSKAILRILYSGDAARIMAGSRLVLDNFWNGQPFDVPLWRLSEEEKASLRLLILPWREDDGRIPDDSVRVALENGHHGVEAFLVQFGCDVVRT